MSARTKPSAAIVRRMADGYVAVAYDQEADEYLHTLVLDADGHPVGPAQRYRTPAQWDDCEIWDCRQWSISGLLGRPWGDDLAAAYIHTYSFSNELYSYYDTDIVIDRIRASGEAVDRLGIDAASGYESPTESITSFDIVPGDQNTLVAYTKAAYGEAGVGEVRWVDNDGTTVQSWAIPGGAEGVSGMTAVALPDGSGRFLLVWLQGGTPRAAILDPGHPVLPPILTFAQGLAVCGRPWLVAGPDRVACVFPANDGGGCDGYAVRFGASGQLLDATPISLGYLPGDQGNVGGTWDGYQFLLTFATITYGSYALYGNRMDSDGAVYDGDGFVIDADGRGPACLDSDAAGHVAAAYPPNRLRRIDDPGPLVDAPEGTAPALTLREALAAARAMPNPSTGEVRLSMPLPERASVRICDAVGRAVLAARAIEPGSDLLWDGRLADGRRAPAGAYFVRIVSGGRVALHKLIVLG